jgi:hypothetical protein
LLRRRRLVAEDDTEAVLCGTACAVTMSWGIASSGSEQRYRFRINKEIFRVCSLGEGSPEL